MTYGDRVAGGVVRACLAVLVVLGGYVAPAHSQESALVWDSADPRIGLKAGLTDAGEAADNLKLLTNVPLPEAFTEAVTEYGASTAVTDMAFQDHLVFVGNYGGFNVYDISDPADPKLRVSVVCPGGQGDLSVYDDLLFMSVEELSGRVDCGTQGVEEAVSSDRFRGVRIFDISDIETPKQVAAVQTCRGSHTHTVVTDPKDDANLYVYVSGTGPVRPAEELAGCAVESSEMQETSLFRIEVIKVPLGAPDRAEVVSEPRIFADESGNIRGLWPGGDHGPSTQRTSTTDQCHDITANSAAGIAGGACSGNGILLDISDPANPRRTEEVVDPNFAYWHSATWNNDGTKLLFTDEWGGGMAPRCLSTDLPTWGADAIFTVDNGTLNLAGYYKLPVPQTETENCVAHNGSMIPVPGRDIMAQAWYQGGLSIFDFTDPANPVEIAFFDRGPLSDSELILGGYWSTYWYNGNVYGTAIVRGLDVFELTPSEHLSQNEIDAARLVKFDEFNPQDQPIFSWPVSFTVARAYLDQLVRVEAVDSEWANGVSSTLDAAEQGEGSRTVRRRMDAFANLLDADARSDEAGGHANEIRRRLASMIRALRQSMN
jgi:hypothetical protein